MASSIALLILAAVVVFLVWRLAQSTDAIYVVTNSHWGPCTEDRAGEGYRCAAIGTVTNQGGSRGAQIYRYLAFYIPDGSGCDVDVPTLDPGASRTLTCQVQLSSNYPSGSGPGIAPRDPPKAIVRQP